MRIPSFISNNSSKKARRAKSGYKFPRLGSYHPEPLEARTLLSLFTLTASEDTYVRGGSSGNTNFNASSQNCAAPVGTGSACLNTLNDNGSSSGNNGRITYLKFPAPPPGTINSALVRLTGAVAGSDPEVRNDDIFGIDPGWSETTLTFNTPGRPVPAAGFLDSRAIAGGAITAYEWNVSTWVRDHQGQQQSFVVQMATQSTTLARHIYRSKEWTNDAQRPKLILSIGVPETPSPLVATAGNGSVTLNWPAVDATSYTIYRGTASGALSIYKTGITTNTDVDTGPDVVNGTQYFYQIVATNGSGDSLPSNEASATPTVGRVAGPTPIVTSGIGQITIDWAPIQFADTYNLYRSTTAGFVPTPADLLQANVTAPYNDAAAVGTVYYYRMTSVNAAGEGDPGPQASGSSGVVGAGTGITANIYDNIDFTGATVTRVDPTIDFDFDLCCAGTPDPTIEVETFSIRWIGKIEPQFTEAYTFRTITDDGVRLWIDNVLVIDKWIDQGATPWDSVPINLIGGQKYDIRMDFYENGGAASAVLHWFGASTTEQAVPTTQLYPDDGVPRRPEPPVGVTANVVDTHTILVLWNDVSFNEDQFVLQRATNPDFTGAIDLPLPAQPNLTSFNDPTVTEGTGYYYRIAARNAVGDSAFTVANEVSILSLVRNINITTVTTAIPNDFGPGQVTIFGATPASFNGTFAIATTPTPTTFTVSNPGPNETASVAGKYVQATFPSVPTPINFQPFPASTPDLVLVDGGDPNTPPPILTGGRLQLTPPINGAAGAAWTRKAQPIGSFTSRFDFQITNSNGADGFVFVIQAAGNNVIGGAGGGLGFAGLSRSVGIKIDFYPNLNQTGVYVNGAMNDTIGTQLNQSTDIGVFGFDFDNGTIYHVDIAYDGATFVYTVSDPAVPTRAVSLHYTVDIPAVIGSPFGFVGFTAANGGLHAQHEILTWNFTSGVPVVNGTSDPDTFYVRQDAPGGSRVHVWKNRDPASNPVPDIDIAKADATNLALSGGRGNDVFTIDMSNGNPLPAGGLLTDGGQNIDTLIVKGTSAAETFLINGTLVTVPGGATFRHLFMDTARFDLGTNVAADPDDNVTVSAAVPFTTILNGGGGNNTLTLNGGTNAYSADSRAGNNDGAGNDTLNIVANGATIINSTTSQHLKSLTLNDTARATLTAGGGKVLRTNSLNIASGAVLDLTDNDLILQAAPGASQSEWNKLTGYLRSGRAGGAWNGNGIRSGSAAANTTRATTLGIILNDAGGGVPIFGTFNGESVNANSVLIKYTYYGDRDFSGTINADDYAAIDAGWANRSDPNNLVFPRQPSRHGDIDLSGTIDADDFFLIDRAFSNQTGVLSSGAGPALAPASSATAASSTSTSKTAAKKKIRKASHHRQAARSLFRVRD